MASGEDAGKEGRGRGQSRWQEGGSILIRGLDNPEELANWRKLRNPEYFKDIEMGNQIIRQLTGISLQFRTKGGDNIKEKEGRSSAGEISSESSVRTNTGTGTSETEPMDLEALFGDRDNADVATAIAATDQKVALFSPEGQDHLKANLDQVTKENEQVKGRLNLLTTEFDQVNKEIHLLKLERSSSQKETGELKNKVLLLEQVRVKMDDELAELKEKVQRMEDSTIPPAVERRGRPTQTPGRKTIQCELCPKRFSFAQSKNLHVQIMHQGRRWYCRYCHLQYSSPAAVYVHMKNCSARLPGSQIMSPCSSRQAAEGDQNQRRPKRRTRRRLVKQKRETEMQVEMEATGSE